MTGFGGAYRGRRVLVTGHTGFKGSWLALWLHELGAEVHGLALAPDTDPAHWTLLGLDIPEYHQDIRDADALAARVSALGPEIVFHLAAQSLVRRSYRAPLGTWATNAMGTANLVDACLHAPSVRAVIIVTSDKCYENRGDPVAFREDDRLGGHDPYSASKAAAELVVASYRNVPAGRADAPLLATARAGNVVGGGDWSEDRLIPDLVRALARGVPLAIRFPDATRPWQHVLESLGGYLLLGQRLLAGDAAAARAWNFGPDRDDNRRVADVLERLRGHWPELDWRADAPPSLHEAGRLDLDSARARAELGWRPVWDLDATLAATAEWYRRFHASGRAISRDQLDDYRAAARAAGLAWALET